MSRLQDIIGNKDLTTPNGVAGLAGSLRELSDAELYQAQMWVHLDSAPKGLKEQAAIARMELDRREQERQESLAVKITNRSTIIGGAAAVVGAIVGALLQHLLNGV